MPDLLPRPRRSPHAAPLVLAAALLLSVPALGLAYSGGGPRATETLEGELVLFHADDLDHGRTSHGYALRTKRGYVNLKMARIGGAAKLAGKRVAVAGTQRDGDFVVARTSSESRSLASANSVPPGTRRVAVLLFNFTNDTREPWTRESVAAVVFGNSSSANAYYREVSYGSVALAGDVAGWYRIPYDNTGCPVGTWANAADAAATAAGVDLSAYANIVYAFPRASSCSFSGAAAVNGSRSWINGTMTVRTVAHELGHNFGVHHASTLNCTEGGVRVTLSSKCTTTEYGDPFSIMGASGNTRHQNHWHRAHIGWLPEVVTVTTAGTYDVAPAELTVGPRLVRIPRGDGNYFYLEFRRPFGAYDTFGSNDPVVTGVSIRLAPDIGRFAPSLLLDTTPSTSSFGDAPLAVGRTFSDSVSGVSVSTVSVSSSGARVNVTFGAASAPTPPPPPRSPTLRSLPAA